MSGYARTVKVKYRDNHNNLNNLKKKQYFHINDDKLLDKCKTFRLKLKNACHDI